jgi:hypothetical protein
MQFNPRDSGFPAQKLPFSKKDDEWRKKCINGAESLTLWRNENLRQSHRNKRINYNLYSDILDQSDIEKVCNPYNIMGFKSPAKLQNYPIANPKIDLLYGESIKRKFDWKVKVMNDDAISLKEEELKERLGSLLAEHIQSQSKTEEDMKQDLANFEKFKTFEYQDLRERRATHILKYLYDSQKLKLVFAKGFKDALISSEEIYQCDIIAGEPIIRKLNPLNVHTIRSGESQYIEDADIIVIVSYMSPGQIIDEYHEYLKDSDVDYIESGMTSRSSGAKNFLDLGSKLDTTPIMEFESIDVNQLASIGPSSMEYEYSNDHNIRVTKTYWRSFRKMKKVKWYDEFGDEQVTLRDENYKIDKSLGEEEEILWINEWWEGHKIGGQSISNDSDDTAIYVRMKPKDVQFRTMENPSKCNPGIVGTIYNTNDNKGVSLMDRMKPYQYLYNILAYNTELMVTKNLGKIMRLDMAYIPEEWELDKWLSFAIGTNMAIQDSFQEGKKGQAQGKLAGTMQQNNPVIDMEMGNSIQLYMNMMSFIKEEMGEIAGVSRARQGQISNREAVNNVEREVTQSSHITEYWFIEHDFLKLRALECLLETAKFAWKDKKNKKVQYILDDQSSVIFDLDGEQFNESEYGLQITDGATSNELLTVMKQLAHAGIQNGLMKFSQLIDIYSNDSIASIRNKFTSAEIEQVRKQEEQFKAEEENKKQIAAQQLELADKMQNFQREEWDREDARLAAELTSKYDIELLKQSAKNSVEEPQEDNSIELEKLKLQAEKLKKDYELKMKDLSEKQRHNKVAETQKDKEITIKRSKPSSTK